jgi:hypothetical protein
MAENIDKDDKEEINMSSREIEVTIKCHTARGQKMIGTDQYIEGDNSNRRALGRG